ncbi:hypothetical protein [Chromobacterium rhizoryzae]|uniref:hypothetical protein n=1 Tax=Chromobacterium rhizoryzae TaxID=1778675 RepID=UPI001D083BC1|nr:hypothetical protein [Chromobacterium rhizoryzae]
MKARLPWLGLAALALLCGALAGLARLGWAVPAAAAALAGWHGALMIGAFFGGVISLERAVALNRGWALLAPAAAGLSGLCLIAGLPPPAAQWLQTLAAAVLLAGSVQVLRRQAAAFTLTLAAAALCWLIGALAWQLGGDLQTAVPWWLAFLILTIAGERLELTRLLPLSSAARRGFALAALTLGGGAVLSLWRPDAGLRLYAAALLALAVWLLRHDIARRNARQRGLTRYIAVALLCGYGWLAVAGALGLAGALLPGHPWRDAALHAVGLGFVFSMVFGHAPIIIPALTRLKLPYRPLFYAPLAALHLSLLLRLYGMLDGAFAWRRAAGLLNALTLLFFIILLLSSLRRGRASAKPGQKEATS